MSDDVMLDKQTLRYVVAVLRKSLDAYNLTVLPTDTFEKMMKGQAVGVRSLDLTAMLDEVLKQSS